LFCLCIKSTMYSTSRSLLSWIWASDTLFVDVLLQCRSWGTC
jgi:hypothetical protein